MRRTALRSLEDLPGPRGWPLLGNSLQVRPGRSHLVVEEWAACHGPLFRIRPGRCLALLQMKMAMAMLLSGFDIDGVDTPDGRPARQRMAFTMHPVGLRLRLIEVG
jgi:hypothetical protein